MNKGIIKCEMLDQFGNWGKMILDSKQFKFFSNYDALTNTGTIQIWKGTNKDWFILRNIEKVNK